MRDAKGKAAAWTLLAALAIAGCRRAESASGWRTFSGWSAGCPLSLPASAGELPAPLRWEACAARLPDGVACRQLADERAIARSPRFWADPAGRAHLLVTFLGAATREWVVGQVDGPLEFAMRMPVAEAERCLASEQDLNEGRFAIRLRGDGSGPALGSDADALLIGRIGRLEPEVFVRDRTPSTASWSVGADWLVRGAAPERALFLHPAADPHVRPTALSAASGALPAGGLPRAIGRQVVYELEGGGLMAWDDRRGLHALAPGAADGNLGTDGVHLVWTRSQGARRSIMAADFTTDPSALVAQRLRSDPDPVVGAHAMRFAVGCGYAGRNAMPLRDLLVVRIVDGVSWQLPAAPGWSWGQVLGFTCDELFATAFSRAGGVSIARVRLDSLGSGQPAD
jgi:hypothetical protein